MSSYPDQKGGVERHAEDVLPADNSAVNSEEYWTSRFRQDWDAFDGPGQTRFFYKYALDNLPGWFLERVRKEKYSVCDWGCATGDGTDLLSQVFNTPVTGVDFSPAAIEMARQRYAKPTFLSVNYLNPTARPVGPAFDVFFTSNTLEHFVNPQEVLTDLQGLAKNYLVVLVPFREYERHHEHETTFDLRNIPITVGQRFHLVFSRVFDTSGHKPAFWEGEQILLIYAADDEIQNLRLFLDDFEITRQSSVSIPELIVAKARIAALEESLSAARGAAEAARGTAEAARGTAEAARGAADSMAAQSAAEVAKLDAHLGKLREELKTVNGQYVDQAQALWARDSQLNDKDRIIEEKRRAAEESERVIAGRNHDVAERDRVIWEMRQSTSWRVTAPLRAVGTLARLGKRKFRSALRLAYHRSPVPITWKQAIRTRLFGGPTLPLPAATTVPEVMPSIVPKFLPPLRGPQERADVFVWGIIDWHFRIQRPQHMARGMARRGHRTYYFSNHFVDDEAPGFRIEALSEDGLLHVVYLNVAGAPSIYSAAASPETTAKLRASLAAFLVQASPKSIVSIVQHPFWVPFADALPNRHLVYDMMDHHEGFGDGAPDILELEERILCEADQVIVTSDFLEDIARKKNRSVRMIRNACEYEHFAEHPGEVFVDPKGRRIIGYYGAIAHWFDVDLVEKVALAFPDDLVLLVGADSAGVQARLSHCPNVEFTGEVTYSSLPFYLYAFDVCLLLFKIIPLTLATNPVKVYEYLSAGKHVIGTDLPEMAQFGDLVHIGQNEEEVMTLIRSSLENPPTDAEVAARRAFASSQTWDDRAQALSTSIERYAAPLVSIIVVCYNKLELTDACLRSLEKNNHYKNIEVIVVDNDSKDATPEYLTEWAKRGDNRRIILNSDNRGFAAANNQGLRIARGEYLVLLNNDTYVTPGWLGTLVRHLQRNRSVGLVGPVTNNIGNEAKIEIAYDSMEEMEYASRLYTTRHMGLTMELYTAAFFCVAFSRDMYERVGDLDEIFGIGMFEDDDYCRRIQELGFVIACAEDVFIHHHHSASFNLLAIEKRMKLFEENKGKYEEKWGAWIPHQHRSANDRHREHHSA